MNDLKNVNRLAFVTLSLEKGRLAFPANPTLKTFYYSNISPLHQMIMCHQQ